ncbi:MAG: MarR family transcriptional regulator [Devosia sp.]
MTEANTSDRSRGLALGRLDQLLGFHLRMASAAVARDFAAVMEGLDLTQKQCAVLELIDANEGVSQIDLAASLGTDRATMMAVVDRLSARRLLSRRRSTVDRRRQVLALSLAGRRLLSDARLRIARHESAYRATFGEARIERLIALLRDF